MPHFAKVENGLVTQVIVADQDFINRVTPQEPLHVVWVQASYNTRAGVHYDPVLNLPDGGVPLRKNYPGVGYTYDTARDAFIPPQPYPSWVLDEASCLWNAPTPYPADGNYYTWDESTVAWVLVNLEVQENG